jgi:hypothetical protein
MLGHDVARFAFRSLHPVSVNAPANVKTERATRNETRQNNNLETLFLIPVRSKAAPLQNPLYLPFF